MVYGNLNYIVHLADILPAEVYQILAKLQKGVYNDLSIGKHEYLGQTIYISADEYQTYPPTERKYEFHRKYVDLQVIISGEEKIYLAAPDVDTSSKSVQVPDSDCWFVEGIKDQSAIAMIAGSFLLIFPNQLHKPCCNNQKQSAIKKLVFKIDAEIFYQNK